MTQESQRWSFERWVAVLSLGVAGLSLAVSFVVLFSGNGNQAQFESDRQRCLDNLLDISEAMRTMKYSGVVMPEVLSSFVSAKVAAEKSCFNGRIFEIGTDFEFVWSRSMDGFASDDSWEFNTPSEGDAARSFDTDINEG